MFLIPTVKRIAVNDVDHSVKKSRAIFTAALCHDDFSTPPHPRM
jgi:hypothetical protein